MDILGTPVGKRRTVKEIIQDIPRTLQVQRANISTTGRKTASFDDNFRRNGDFAEYNLGWVLPVLQDKYRTNSKNSKISRGTDKFSFSSSETISEMGSTPGDRISSNSTCDQCDVEVQATEDNQLFVRGVANRSHRTQTNFSEDSSGLRPSAPASPPTGRERECDPGTGGLALRQLCREQSIGSASTLETKLTNPISFDFNDRTEKQATLQKLSCDLEAQYSQDVPTLLDILEKFYPFSKTSSDVLGDVLEDSEINDFLKLYDISNVRPILASDDDHVFWLEDTAGIIYMWSRVDSTMSYLGRELREALVNYLFHQDNICYVVEFTHEIIPKIEVDKKAREIADSVESIEWEEWVVTKESLNPVKRNEKKKKKKGKKKGKKKKNKH